jgi:hypothetical protein
MGRPKGALNKRTRAALSAVAEGKLGAGAEKTLCDLLRLAQDQSAEISVRMRAAEILLPYCKPRLAAIEQTTIEPRDQLDPAEVEAKLVAQFSARTESLERLISLAITTMPELRSRLLALLQETPAVQQSGNVIPLTH